MRLKEMSENHEGWSIDYDKHTVKVWTKHTDDCSFNMVKVYHDSIYSFLKESKFVLTEIIQIMTFITCITSTGISSIDNMSFFCYKRLFHKREKSICYAGRTDFHL